MSHEHHHTHTHDLAFEAPEMAADAELEGEVFLPLVDEAAVVIADRCAQDGVQVRRVIDVGCGPGVGTCALAQRFTSAIVMAIDGSADVFERVGARTERLGLASRVEVRRVDLSGELPMLGRADVVWASMVLHHVGDEVAALRQIHDLLEPSGVLALVERAGPLRVLPGDADPGLSARLDAAWAAWFDDMRSSLPGATSSEGYPSMLARAGLEVVGDQVLTLDLDAPLEERARRFARRSLERTRDQLVHHADAADLDALEAVLADDPGDLRIRAARQLLLATRQVG